MKELENTVNATPTPLVTQSQTSVEESSVPSPYNGQKEESVTSIDKFLQNSGRKIHHIKDDGKCMFRTFSYAFLIVKSTTFT